MTILITGGAGFIGSHLCDRLLENDHSVVAVDNLSMGRIENLSDAFKSPKFSFEEIDVLDFKKLDNLPCKFDAIAHFAAFKIPRYGNSLKTLEINSKGTFNVLELARKNKCKFILASTSDVYGKNTEIPFNEESNIVIGSSRVRRWSYSASKIFDEHISFAYADEYEIPITIIRIFGSYGPRNHRNWWGGPQSVFIDAILSGKEIEIHGDGLQTRSFCYIDDLVDGIVKVITEKETNSEIINLGSTEEIKILDLANKINNLIDEKKDIKIRFIPYISFTGKKYEDPLRRVPDISKARKLIGFNPRVSLTEGLQRTIIWHKKVHQ